MLLLLPAFFISFFRFRLNGLGGPLVVSCAAVAVGIAAAPPPGTLTLDDWAHSSEVGGLPRERVRGDNRAKRHIWSRQTGRQCRVSAFPLCCTDCCMFCVCFVVLINSVEDSALPETASWEEIQPETEGGHLAA